MQPIAFEESDVPLDVQMANKHTQNRSKEKEMTGKQWLNAVWEVKCFGRLRFEICPPEGVSSWAWL